MAILERENVNKRHDNNNKKVFSTNQFWSSLCLLNALHFFALDWYSEKIPLELRPIFRGENKVISQIHYDFSIQAAEKDFVMCKKKKWITKKEEVEAFSTAFFQFITFKQIHWKWRIVRERRENCRQDS